MESTEEDLKGLSWNERIQEKYSEFSKKQRRVINFVKSKYDYSSKFSAEYIAQRLQISRLTIQRLCKKLGYDGYKDFIQGLKEEYFKGITPSAASENLFSKKYQSGFEVFCKGLEVDHYMIEKLCNSLEETKISEIISEITKAKSIYIIGLAAGFFPSIYLGERLGRLRKRVKTITGARRMVIDSVFSISENDLLIIFEYSNPIRFISEIIDYAHQKGAKVVTIADFSFSPNLEKSDLSLVIERGMPGFKNSMAIPMSVANAFLVAIEYGMEERGETLKNLKELDGLKKKLFDDYF